MRNSRAFESKPCRKMTVGRTEGGDDVSQVACTVVMGMGSREVETGISRRERRRATPAGSLIKSAAGGRKEGGYGRLRRQRSTLTAAGVMRHAR